MWAILNVSCLEREPYSVAFRRRLGIILGHFEQQSQETGLKAKTSLDAYGIYRGLQK